MRKASIKRETKETHITLDLDLDGSGRSEVDTGIGFLDHMLTLLAKHSGMDLKLACKGDLEVDQHHTVEDIGIVLGKAISKALGDKMGIRRYAGARIPMDEALVSVDLDISGRPFLVFNAHIRSRKTGGFETCLTEEFFRAFAHSALITLHINCEYGKNDHHIIEGMFKGLGRALRDGVDIDPRLKGQIPSSKGVL
jgi:imidazoleglycerol-phosphate dehydratase